LIWRNANVKEAKIVDLIQNLKNQVKPLGKKVVLPEYQDERVLVATEIILKEAVILSLWGAGIGSFLGFILSIIELPLIASKFSMPFLSPSIMQYIGIFVLSFILAVIIGPLSTVRVVKKLTDKDSYLSLREEM